MSFHSVGKAEYYNENGSKNIVYHAREEVLVGGVYSHYIGISTTENFRETVSLPFSPANWKRSRKRIAFDCSSTELDDIFTELVQPGENT